MLNGHGFFICLPLAVTLVLNAPAQTSSSSDQARSATAIEGTVESVARETMVVRTDDNQHHLFVYGAGMVRPAGLAVGKHVRIDSIPTDEAGIRVATRVTIVEPG